MSDIIKLAVFNEALYECGVDKITVLGQSSSEGWRVLDEVYAATVDEMLWESDWDWALKAVGMTGTETSATTPFGYEYALQTNYADALRLVGVYRTGRGPRCGPLSYEYREGVVYCDDSTAEIVFVSSTRGRDESYWPQPIRRLVSLMLADKVVARLSRSARSQAEVMARLKEARHNAKSVTRSQRSPRRPPTGRFVRAHLGGSTR